MSDAFRELNNSYGMPMVVDPWPSAIFQAIGRITDHYACMSAEARRAILERYDWWSMYETMDQEFRNAVAFKMQMTNA